MKVIIPPPEAGQASPPRTSCWPPLWLMLTPFCWRLPSPRWREYMLIITGLSAPRLLLRSNQVEVINIHNFSQSQNFLRSPWPLLTLAFLQQPSRSDIQYFTMSMRTSSPLLQGTSRPSYSWSCPDKEWSRPVSSGSSGKYYKKIVESFKNIFPI